MWHLRIALQTLSVQFWPFLRGREKDRRRKRSTLETCIWPSITCFDYEASQNSHILLLLLLQSSTSRSLPLFFWLWLSAPNSLHRSAEAEQHSGYRRGWERCVVYNWIGLLRNYTRLLLFTFLLTDWINSIVFCWRHWETIKLILYWNVCFVTKVKGKPSAPAVCLFHFNWSDVCQTYWSSTDLQKCLEP